MKFVILFLAVAILACAESEYPKPGVVYGRFDRVEYVSGGMVFYFQDGQTRHFSFWKDIKCLPGDSIAIYTTEREIADYDIWGTQVDSVKVIPIQRDSIWSHWWELGDRVYWKADSIKAESVYWDYGDTVYQKELVK